MEENSLSIVGLIFNAGLVVQLVMIILVLMSTVPFHLNSQSPFIAILLPFSLLLVFHFYSPIFIFYTYFYFYFNPGFCFILILIFICFNSIVTSFWLLSLFLIPCYYYFLFSCLSPSPFLFYMHPHSLFHFNANFHVFFHYYFYFIFSLSLPFLLFILI